MSTYYYMACDDHKKRTKEIIAVTRIAGSHIDNSDKLLKFLMDHHGCSLRFFSEYDEERYGYQQVTAEGEGNK